VSDIEWDETMAVDERFKRILDHESWKKVIATAEGNIIFRVTLYDDAGLTTFGEQFCNACIGEAQTSCND
jgi:hypothetical protein